MHSRQRTYRAKYKVTKYKANPLPVLSEAKMVALIREYNKILSRDYP